MWLFNKHKGNKKGFKDAIHKIYSNADKSELANIFYGNESSVIDIMLPFMKILYGEHNDYSHSQVEFGMHLYVEIWIRKHGGFSSEYMTSEYIVGVLQEKYNDLSEETTQKAVEYCVKVIYSHEPPILKRDLDLELMKKMAEQVKQNAEKNRDIEQEFMEDPEYGLVIEKPVFVPGFGADKEYLSQLCAENGEALIFNRIGSQEVEGISGAVDIYHAEYEDHRFYKKLFLCNYGNIMPTIAPDGFIISIA